MATYDSAKVREIADRIRLLASGMEAEVTPGIRNAGDGMEALRGRTAEAMEERLTQLRQSSVKLAQEFGALAQLANTYADRLEEIDQELAEKL